MKKTTLGVIISNRSFFPAHLVTAERVKILAKLEAKAINTIILSETDTPLGAVMTYSDAQACARLFNANRDVIDGILVILPNFGDEVGVATAIDLAKLNVPILVQACDDSLDRMELENRRDAFCGKLSLCNNLYQRRRTRFLCGSVPRSMRRAFSTYRCHWSPSRRFPHGAFLREASAEIRHNNICCRYV